MQGLLRRSVLILVILLSSSIRSAVAMPRDSAQPDAAVVPLLDPAAMPESAILVARAATTSRAATTIRFPYVPQSEYLPTQTNYWEGRDGASIDYIVIHYTDISYARTLRAFNRLASDVSAHYVIRGDGHIAQTVSEAPYPDIGEDDAALVSVVLRNTGSTAWRKGTEQEARLGISGNSADLAFLSDGWPTPERPAVQQEDIVPPGETATFSFRVKGAVPGTFVLPLRGVVDGAAWMDDLGMYTVVTVR